MSGALPLTPDGTTHTYPTPRRAFFDADMPWLDRAVALCSRCDELSVDLSPDAAHIAPRDMTTGTGGDDRLFPPTPGMGRVIPRSHCGDMSRLPQRALAIRIDVTRLPF